MSKNINKIHVVILDTSGISDYADYGGMLYELKKVGICDGKEFQIDNSYDLLMKYNAFKKCKHILKNFNIKAINQ